MSADLRDAIVEVLRGYFKDEPLLEAIIDSLADDLYAVMRPEPPVNPWMQWGPPAGSHAGQLIIMPDEPDSSSVRIERRWRRWKRTRIA